MFSWAFCRDVKIWDNRVKSGTNEVPKKYRILYFIRIIQYNTITL